MNLSLENKVVVVAGGTRGIGRSIAQLFLAERCRVVVAARGVEGLAEFESAFGKKDGRLSLFSVDLFSEDGAERLIAHTVQTFGQVDVLINVAGGSSGSTFVENKISDMELGMQRNYWSAVRTSKAALPSIRKSKGTIIHISSIWGIEAGGLIAYNTAKAAVVSLTKAMGRELAKDQVRVVGVAPGSILHAGGSWERRIQADPEGMAQFVRNELPWGRFGTPEEVANVVVFLASPLASWVTGTTVVVDGGQSRSF